MVWLASGLTLFWMATGALTGAGIALADTAPGPPADAGGGTSNTQPAKSDATPAEPSGQPDPGSTETHESGADQEVAGNAEEHAVDGDQEQDSAISPGSPSSDDSSDPEEVDADADPPVTDTTPTRTPASAEPTETTTHDDSHTTAAPDTGASDEIPAVPEHQVTAETTAATDPADPVVDAVEMNPTDAGTTVDPVPGTAIAESDPLSAIESVNKDAPAAAEPVAMTIAVAAEDIAPKAAATTGSPNLINIIGTIFFAVFDFISSILEGPPAVPARLEDQVTVGRSMLDIDCGSGHSVYADWYFPTSETPPTGLIYFQHGWPGRAGFYNETAAELAVRTNSIVLAPSITGNFMACDACNLTSDQMHYAVAELFSGDWSALTASASAAAGHDIVLPRNYILAGHSGGGLLAAGVAGYAARIAELTGQPLQLAGVLLWDTGAANDTVERGLAALPTDVPVLSLSAEPSSLNGFSELDAVLDAARPGQFIGLRLAGATHGDFSQSTNPLVQAGMNLFGGQPTAVNTQAVLAISQGWIADMFAGTVFDPEARTGVYGDRGTSVTIITPAGTATADVLPGTPHQWTLGDYISVLLQNSLGLLASSPCAANVDDLLDAEFGAGTTAGDAVGACQV